MTDLDDFLAECDDVIDDWNGSFDSASWSADGNHERDMGAHYRIIRPAMYSNCRTFIAPVSDEAPNWTEITDLLSMREIAAERPELFDRDETTTHINDARQEVEPRRGVGAQHSPYGPQRRSRR